MDISLYHPELGYYARAAQKTGRAGDFFTSVDVGPIFGELLAKQFAEMWQILQSGSDPRTGTGGQTPIRSRRGRRGQWASGPRCPRRSAEGPSRVLLCHPPVARRTISSRACRAAPRHSGRTPRLLAHSSSASARRDLTASSTRTNCSTRCRRTRSSMTESGLREVFVDVSVDEPFRRAVRGAVDAAHRRIPRARRRRNARRLARRGKSARRRLDETRGRIAAARLHRPDRLRP